MELNRITEIGLRLKNNISKVIVGKEEIIDLVIVSLFCNGHVLMEDVPGTGKTVLAKCLAKSVDCDFKRIQFTPDLLPSDLTGINYFNQKLGEFIFRAGPLFSNIILADEINRATPRTQSSLLECMEERQITIDGDTKKLSNPFFVIATQNPIEIQGTFPLPEAQLDRFFMKIKLGYPSFTEARMILDRFQNDNPLSTLESVTAASEIVAAQSLLPYITINSATKDYIVNIVEATRVHEKINLGVSPRGSLALMRASQALAILRGRNFVTPDDVKYLAIPVLAHRIVLKGRMSIVGANSTEAIILDILAKTPVPVEDLT